MDAVKASVIIEALPYIKKYRGQTFVIKYGGSIMKNQQAKKAFLEDVALMKLVGINIVIVHGGGPNISDLLDKLQIQSQFVKGLRITDEKTMEAVEMVLSGQINKQLSCDLCQQEISAVGLSGRDGGLIKAQKKYLNIDGQNIDMGYVGEVVHVNKEFLQGLIDKDMIPVISPVGCDNQGNAYNINADYVASAISSALEAEKLMLITDIEGIYKDINEKSTFISSITVDEIKEYIEKEIIQGGMIPKAECCIEALEGGTKNVHLIDGRREHSVLLEVFTDKGIGTMIRGRD